MEARRIGEPATDPSLGYRSPLQRIELDRVRIERLLESAAETLTGDWVLVGGAAAAVWFAPSRTTEDIDLIGPHGTNADLLLLMEIAESHGLPVETINPAAGFYLRRVTGWDQELVLLRQGRAHIYRPNATLFLLLKLGRLGEKDLDDCVALLAWSEANGEPIDRTRVTTALAILAATTDVALAERRQQLADALAR